MASCIYLGIAAMFGFSAFLFAPVITKATQNLLNEFSSTNLKKAALTWTPIVCCVLSASIYLKKDVSIQVASVKINISKDCHSKSSEVKEEKQVSTSFCSIYKKS